MHYCANVNKTVERLKSAGEETRLRILRLLIHAGEELCVCELVDVLAKPQYTVSKSLTNLKKAELVEERRDGKLMMYRLKPGTFNDHLFRGIAALTPADPLYRHDFARLDRRLALRREGRCVVTYP